MKKLNDSEFVKKKGSGFAEISCIEATLERKGLLETGILAVEKVENSEIGT